MYETVYSSDTITTISVLFALGGACVAVWAALTIYWNLREIGRDRARTKRGAAETVPNGRSRPA